nr:acyl-CoA carboxylase epsilon subunit [Streptomyces sp. 846.5]
MSLVIVRGQADAEDLAALTAVLLARTRRRPAPDSSSRSTVRWRRLERVPSFRAYSWQG